MEELYNTIAKDFNKKRYKVWRKVADFLDTLESDTTILEIGCGNGKNMLYRNDLHFSGIDISKEQVEICKAKKLNVIQSNMTKLPFEDNSFDSIICIATYHHLASDEERKESLYEIYRVLKKDGKALLCVWAMEQPENSLYKFSSCDEMVPWKLGDSVFYRYYHIYKEGDLQKEVSQLCPELTIDSVFYDCGNWYVVLSK